MPIMQSMVLASFLILVSFVALNNKTVRKNENPKRPAPNSTKEAILPVPVKLDDEQSWSYLNKKRRRK